MALIRIVLILLTLISGIFLHMTGRPYNTLLFTFHKLACMAFVILETRAMLGFVKEFNLTGNLLLLMMISIVALLALLISGGAMSLEKSHKSMFAIHRISTFVFVPSITLLLFSILFSIALLKRPGI